jgi:8-oxo-dGTP pyrophosphatase MutT (NUDIX family)
LTDKDSLFSLIESIENGEITHPFLILQASDFEQLKQAFFSHYKLIEAAGGLVFNPQGEVLAIQRMGYWDLPKGKIEKKESPEEAAIREVQEETGLLQVSLGPFICHTYHTYINPRKNQRVLKMTHWYRMRSIESKLTPQKEEDIELAIWVALDTLLQKTPIYRNILDVLGKLA